MSQLFSFAAFLLSSVIASSQGFTISTFAGNGTIGSYGDPAPALAAQFDGPQCVAA